MDPAIFFDSQREAIKTAALADGGTGVVRLIKRLEVFAERLTLYTLARRALVLEDSVPGGLDAVVAVANAGLSEVEAGLSVASDPEERQHLLRALHMLNFNLAADLADCWPGDDTPRQRHHFERGLKAGEALLSPVFEGAVTPQVLANDFWVRGMHRLSLGRPAEAHKDWAEALKQSAEAAARLGIAPAGKDSTLQCLLMTGYLGLATFLLGGAERRETGRTIYVLAKSYLEARRRREEESVEAAYFVDQIQKVQRAYAPELDAA